MEDISKLKIIQFDQNLEVIQTQNQILTKRNQALYGIIIIGILLALIYFSTKKNSDKKP